jgi:hypothetical protein
MNDDDAFTAVPLDPQLAAFHRREAARLRGLAAEATTETMRGHLEDRAREHDRLAGDLVSATLDA